MFDLDSEAKQTFSKPLRVMKHSGIPGARAFAELLLRLPETCQHVEMEKNWNFVKMFHTLYFDVEERRLSRPGTEQKMSVGRADNIKFSFILMSLARIPGNPSSAFCNDIFIIILKLQSFLLISRLQIYEHHENKSLKHVLKKVSCRVADYWPYQYESLKCMDSFYQHRLVIIPKVNWKSEIQRTVIWRLPDHRVGTIRTGSRSLESLWKLLTCPALL